MRGLLIFLLRLYRYILSPWLGPRCRFVPSCSEYALETLRIYGLWRASWLIMKRLVRCHPWHPGGYDPVESPSVSVHQQCTHHFSD